MDKVIRDIPKEKRKSVVSRKKGWERLKIRELLKKGHSHHEIKAQLGNISDSTFWNRMNEIRMEDNELIKKKLLAEGTYLVTDLTVLDDRLGDAIKFCDTLIESDKTSPFLKLEAEKFRVDVSVAKFKLQVEGPRVIDEVTKPVAKVITGQLQPVQAIQALPKLKTATNEEREKFKSWADQVAVEREEIAGSQAEKGHQD